MEEITVNIAVATVSSVEQDALGKIFRFTRGYKFLRFTGHVLRVKAKLKNKLNDFKIGELTVTETEECKTLWILHNQKFITGKDNFTKVKNSLNLFYDDKENFFVKTRIRGIESFSFDKNFPILLKKDSYFTELIVLNTSAGIFHSGVNSN